MVFLRAFFGFVIAVLLVLSPVKAVAGSFALNWGTAPYTWTPLSLGPNTYSVTDQFGFQLSVRFTVTRANGASAGNYPDDLLTDGGANTFGTQISIWQVWNPNLTGGGVGGSTNTFLLEVLNGGTPFGVNGLSFRISDVDSVDSNNAGFASDRCDFITLTGNAGNPALSAVTGSPVFIIGPGSGAGATGVLAANQAQCNFQVSTFVLSATSNGNDNGTVLATYPNGTHTATVLYDESIHNVTGVTSVNALPRGIGVWAATAFSVNNTISLAKSTASTSYTAAGQVITYTYTITNNGPLPINTGQNIQIQDDKVGTFTCGTISAPVASGGTHSCTANYTVLAADILATNITNNAIAGVGTGAQTFATRLQSNTAQVIVPNHAPRVRVQKISQGATGTFTFSGSTNLVATPAGITTVSAGTATPASPTATNATAIGTAVTITEAAVAGWGLTGFSCTDANSGVTGNPASFGTFVSATRVGTIPATNVRAQADITCVFTNSRTRVSVQKVTLGGTTSVTFSGATNLASTPTGITTATPGVAAPVSPTAVNVTTVGTAVTVTEAAVAGYALTGFGCTDANSGVTGNPASFGTFVAATRIGTIPAANVRAGADIRCTFTNARIPAVRVQKTSNGGIGTFSFSASTNLAATPGNITTATAGTAAPASPSATNVTTTGTAVTITENAAAGYALTAFTCSDANSGVTGNPASFGTFVSATRVGTIPAANVVVGADITCVFTNTRPTVRVQKISLGGTGTFGFASSTNLAATPGNIATATAGIAAPGSPAPINVTTVGTAVSITESAVAGYNLAAFTCADANSAMTGNPASFGTFVAATRVGTIPAANVIAGADIRCTFTNNGIDAVDNNFSSVPINGTTGGTTASVFTNDTLGNAAFANSAVVASITNTGGLTGVLINSNGTMSVPPGTSAGTYLVTYQICEAAAPTNCDTAVATILVSVTPPTGGTSCVGTNLAVNGGVELPVVAPATVNQLGTSSVPGWSTNDTSIEVWGTGFNGVPSHTGNAFMEMNANIGTSILVQAPSTIQRRAQLDVYWAHRGRQGDDTARLTIADNGGGSTTTPNFTTGNTAWIVRSAIHVATDTATGITLSFDSISSTGGASLGNFIDTVEVCQTYLTLDKSLVSISDVDSSSSHTAGDTVQYQFAIANPTGNNRSFASVSFIDDKIGTVSVGTPASGDSNTNGFLDPGETWIANASYTLTQADINAATVVNVAYSQADTGTNTLRSDDDTFTVPLTAAPSIAVTKTASAPGFTTGNIVNAPAGTVVTYTYVVTNSGNQTISGITLSDVHNASGPAPTPSGEVLSNDVAPLANSSDATPSNGVWSSLAPGDSVTFTGTYTISQTDVDVLQ